MFPFWVDVAGGLWLPWMSAVLVGLTCLMQVFAGAR
jgi:hypothetical protein